VVVFLVASLSSCALFWTEPLVAFTLLERATPQLVWRVDTDERMAALSFDDGPDPTYTPQILDILQEYSARATFFVIGERALRHPELVTRIRASGHEVANHYFTRGSALRHSDAEFESHLERTELAAQIKGLPKLFRPPGGLAWPSQLRVARDRGYTCVLGNAYPHDPAQPPVWYMKWLVAKNLAPGSIVILHDGIADPTGTVEALPSILEAAGDKGLRVVGVGELLAAAHSRRTSGCS